MSRNCWIFDLDGTLANLDHRLHHIQSKPKNWDAFNAGIMDDYVVPQTASLLRTMYNLGKGIIICSGRNGVVREQTEQWLDFNSIPYDALYMRKNRDYRPDTIIKSELLDQIIAAGWQPEAVVDDRMRVCKMWHDRGIFVFCVNQGFIEF